MDVLHLNKNIIYSFYYLTTNLGYDNLVKPNGNIDQWLLLLVDPSSKQFIYIVLNGGKENK